MNVQTIVESFGGIRPFARALGHRNPGTVQGWKERKTIPSGRIPEIMAAAEKEGIDLTLEDFFSEAA